MKKKRKWITRIICLAALIVLGSFLLVTLNAEVRFRVGTKLGFVTADTSLHREARRGRIDEVKRLISEGYRVNAKDKWGVTPLLRAADTGRTEVAEYLITRGAKVNVRCKSLWMQAWWWKDRKWLRDLNEWSPLHVAVYGQHVRMVDLLLANKADVNLKNHDGCTPLHLADNVRIAQRLIEEGASVKAKDNNGETPLHKMIGREDVARLLIDSGADVNAKDKDGIAVLNYAVMTDLMELLINRGAEPTVHSLAYMNKLESLENAIEEGIDVNARDKFGQTALHLAALAGREKVIKFLIESGADIDDAEGIMKLTPLEMASLAGHQDVAQVLINNGADVNQGQPLRYAVNNGHHNMVKFLLENDASANAVSLRLPKSWNYRSSSEDCGQGVWLGVSVTSTSGSSLGPLPKKLAEQVVLKGPKLGVQSKWPISLMWIARHTENMLIVELLQECRAVDMSIHQAAAEGNIEQVQLHISHGTDVNEKYRNRTPLSYARDNGNAEIAEFLVKHGGE